MSKKKKLIRAAFRDAVFTRDKHRCVMCGMSGEEQHLDAHHITDRNEMPNGGYVKENGISLCPECHVKAEVYHSTDHEDHVEGFLPEDLYQKVGSSYAKAYAASERLS